VSLRRFSLQSFGIHSDSAHSSEIITKPGNSRFYLYGVPAFGGMTDADREVDRFPRELLDLICGPFGQRPSGEL
jgi:hypothetical protein